MSTDEESRTSLLDSANAEDDGDPGGGVADSLSARMRLLVLVTLAGASFSSNLNAFGAFFFTAALEKAPNTGAVYRTAVGGVYSISYVVGAVVIPLITKDLPNIGSKNLMVLSYFVTGATQLMFAYVGDIQDWRVFLVYCYCIRILQGVAYVTSSVAVMSYLTRLYPANLGFVNGFQMMFLSSGHIGGILLGGAMYDVGGFKAPFLTSGAIILLASAAVLLLLVDVDELKAKSGKATCSGGNGRTEQVVSVSTILRSPWVLLMVFLLILRNMAYSGIEPVLGPRMKNRLGSPAVVVGAVLTTEGVTSTLIPPIVGVILDRGFSAPIMITAGLALDSLSFFLMAPATFLHISPSLWLFFVGILPLSIGNVLMQAPCVVSMSQHLEQTGVGNSVQLRVAVAGLSRWALTVGFALGPVVFSPMVGALGFQLALTIIGLAYLCLAAGMVVLSWLHHVALNVLHKHADIVKTSDNTDEGDNDNL
ncbi:MFS-type transporter SLC18B1-like [Sycon ciliatum]|uniref:MFS-type transporter SLC18B1-like n=1 Tax=Sycon ciliatum TaxID=27933 RepID=UPI0031F663DD